MKTVLLSAVIVMAVLSGGCLKDKTCDTVSVDSQDAAMQSYIAANGMTATKHSSGLYYQIINPGSGATPNGSNTLKVKYTGKLTNGTVFDSQTSTPYTLTLAQVISGWRIGLPLIQEGGIIKLVIPAALGYGCATVASIPPNSILYFEIELVDVI